ncbi:Predicted nucleotidyltransferase [Desulfuromusa kysingii]|uniref:tRNA(Met) cytidine acetate ligase n=1 Tax=Desulfuromusa kysingii TaxID=37625 RepID=A0A1H4C888_9BACT|nr:nucleotidyltransferase [Desulfuromusa kysingii]SEA56556.1 Predicted nucleotidyltransferase [Desulfuromusa kysingii]
MQAVGLITEYNPFHNGHLHHLRESLRVTGAEVAVAVMSGHFLQRGEPALLDKWGRAEMALRSGVDVVVELPLPWACSSAPDFSRGGVKSLALLGVDSLCFGSECGEIEPLQYCADFLHDNDSFVTGKTSELLRQGVNYPQARAQVLTELSAELLDPTVITAPNNILGIEYLKVLKELTSTIQPVTIARIGAGYHDVDAGVDGIASATGIRQKMLESEAVDTLLPPTVQSILHQATAHGRVVSVDKYYQLLLAQIFRSPTELSDLWLVENGIENRLLTVAENATSLAELVSGLKSRQLTRTRIQRLLVSVLLGLKRDIVPPLLAVGPQYLHLLAASAKGQKFLASRRKQRSIPLVQNFSRVYAILKRHYGFESAAYRLALEQLNLELKATKLYTLLSQDYTGGSRNRDFYESLKI